jgi:nucleoside-diphosphate-sugar epimerase
MGEKGKVLVNGAGGFLGSHTVEYLVDAGYAVRATDLPGADLSVAESCGAEVVRADLLEPSSIPALFEGVERVVNIAGLFNYSLPMDVLRRANVEVTRNMCEASLDAEIERFVHTASIAVYGNPRMYPMSEDHPRKPVSNYEVSKYEGEDVVMSYHRDNGLPAVSLRPAGIYGPRSRYGQTTMMTILALVKNAGFSRIPGMKGGPRMHHVHARDVAQAIKILLEAEGIEGNCYNVADDEPLSQGDFFQVVMQAYGMESLFPFPYFTRLYWPFIRMTLALPDSAFNHLNNRLNGKWSSVVAEHDLEPALTANLDRQFFSYMRTSYGLDTSRLKGLGYKPHYPDPRKGFLETIKWYQDAGWLPKIAKNSQ